MVKRLFQHGWPFSRWPTMGADILNWNTFFLSLTQKIFSFFLISYSKIRYIFQKWNDIINGSLIIKDQSFIICNTEECMTVYIAIGHILQLVFLYLSNVFIKFRTFFSPFFKTCRPSYMWDMSSLIPSSFDEYPPPFCHILCPLFLPFPNIIQVVSIILFIYSFGMSKKHRPSLTLQQCILLFLTQPNIQVANKYIIVNKIWINIIHGP